MWTSVLHLKLLSTNTAPRNSLLWSTSHCSQAGFLRVLFFDSRQVSSLLWNDACPLLKRSGPYFGTPKYLLHTPFKNIMAIIHLERVGEDFQWPKTMKMINPLLPVQRDSQTTPAQRSYFRSERRPDLVSELRERFTVAFLSLQAIFCNCCIS